MPVRASEFRATLLAQGRITMDWKAGVRFLAKEVRVIARILRHPGSPWPARLIAGAASAYLLSPVQLIPTIIPVVGQLDDALVVCLAMRLIRRLTPEIVFAECTDAHWDPASLKNERAVSQPQAFLSGQP